MPRIKPINPRIKYYPPRLMEQLEYIKSYPLTLVETPSGFGKTTILEHFFDSRLPKSILQSRYEFMQVSSGKGWGQFCAMIAQADADCASRYRQGTSGTGLPRGRLPVAGRFHELGNQPARSVLRRAVPSRRGRAPHHHLHAAPRPEQVGKCIRRWEHLEASGR